jgi:hypothetical protein
MAVLDNSPAVLQWTGPLLMHVCHCWRRTCTAGEWACMSVSVNDCCRLACWKHAGSCCAGSLGRCTTTTRSVNLAGTVLCWTTSTMYAHGLRVLATPSASAFDSRAQCAVLHCCQHLPYWPGVRCATRQLTFMIQVPPVRLNSSTNILYSLGTTYVTGKKLYAAASAALSCRMHSRSTSDTL